MFGPIAVIVCAFAGVVGYLINGIDGLTWGAGISMALAILCAVYMK
jgi:hypothetical protein